MNINVLEYLEKTAADYPERLVYRDEKDSITFGRLLELSRRAGSLLSKKIDPRKPVLVVAEKNLMTPVMYYGVLYAGAYYVPVSRDLPAYRINLIIKTVGASLMLAGEEDMEFVSGLDFDGEVVTAPELICADTDKAALDAVRSRAMDTDPAYVIFTSGSTGVPKGVIESHRQLIDYIEAFTEAFDLGPDEIYGNQSPLDYIAAIRDLYIPLKTGAQTVFIPKKYFSIPAALFDYINEHRVSTICWVVGALVLCSEFRVFDSKKLETVKKVIFTGSVMPCRHLRVWQDNLPDALFVNHYGPTEITASCTYYVVDHPVQDDETLPIGVPFRNTGIILLDENGREAEYGEQGEICVRGTSISLGYYRNPEKTKEAFIVNPANDVYEEIIYATGDIGRYMPDGNLEFLGRKDHQIKHMGHRVELGEIEAAVLAMPETGEAVCMYNKEKQQIWLFYSGETDQKAIGRHLREILPAFMVPRKYKKLDVLPKSFNGKINLTELRSMME